MVGVGGYLIDVAAVAAVLLPLGVAAVRIRQAAAPAWDGAIGRLLEAVLALALLTTVALALGTAGALSAPPLIAACLLIGAAAELSTRNMARVGYGPFAGSRLGSRNADAKQSELAAEPETDLSDTESSAGSGLRAGCVGEGPPAPPIGRARGVATLALITAVFAQWGIAVTWSLDAGIQNFDSVWYHLPFAAEFAQSGATTGLARTETVFLNWFYPQGSELVHAIGMVLIERDTLSLAINLGWLGLAFLAAWCIGRPYGRGDLTVAAAAILLGAHNLIAREPGTAKNDIVVIALVLAAAAILVNLARSRGGRPAALTPSAPMSKVHFSKLPLLLAALATGLAVGVKVTALAPALGLTVAAVALAPSGRRLVAAGWWALGLVIGGGYWYVRNLIVAGNPLPQVQDLGPLSLPGPESLQTGRPDFNVLHYLGDGAVWRDYFLPGLERGFGVLWPVVIAAALLGAVWALLRALGQHQDAGGDDSRGAGHEDGGGGDDGDRGGRGHGAGAGAGAGVAAVGWLGLTALVALAAYLVTPLGAAGPEGHPTAFAINLRFAFPGIALGLVLLPLVLPLPRATPSAPRARMRDDRTVPRRWPVWAAFLTLVAVAAVTNDAEDLFTADGAAFGWAVGLGLVAAPAAIVAVRAVGRRRWVGRAAIVSLIAFAAGALGVGHQLQDHYLEHRYTSFQPQLGLSAPYRWASPLTGTSIGLAGTTAGFHGYGFYGAELSNTVSYLGEEAPAGGFHPIAACPDFRRAVNRAELDYLVTSPFLNFLDPSSPIPSPEHRWIARDPAVRPVLRDAGGAGQPVTVWRLVGALEPGGCGPRETPLRQVPDTP